MQGATLVIPCAPHTAQILQSIAGLERLSPISLPLLQNTSPLRWLRRGGKWPERGAWGGCDCNKGMACRVRSTKACVVKVCDTQAGVAFFFFFFGTVGAKGTWVGAVKQNCSKMVQMARLDHVWMIFYLQHYAGTEMQPIIKKDKLGMSQCYHHWTCSVQREDCKNPGLGSPNLTGHSSLLVVFIAATDKVEANKKKWCKYCIFQSICHTFV